MLRSGQRVWCPMFGLSIVYFQCTTSVIGTVLSEINANEILPPRKLITLVSHFSSSGGQGPGSKLNRSLITHNRQIQIPTISAAAMGIEGIGMEMAT